MGLPSAWTWSYVLKRGPSLSCILHVNKVAVQHAILKPLTRQLKGNQIIEIGVAYAPTKDIHNIIDEDGSMT
jgi:hypothetical protein